MEPVFGGLLIEAYCDQHKDERLDPSVLVARAREALEDGPPDLLDVLDEMEVRRGRDFWPHGRLALVLVGYRGTR